MTSPLLSPDGRWRWDGTAWAPVQPAIPQARAARWVALIVAGSIALLLALGTGYALLANSITPGSLAPTLSLFAPDCVPAAFPRYPGSTLSSLAATSTGCVLSFATPDAADQVLTYFYRALQNDPWTVTGGGIDQGVIDFGRTDGNPATGSVRVTTFGSPTTFTIQYRRSG